MQSIEENKSKRAPKHTFNILYRFFCWCSGARLYILKQCPSEYNKYYGIGVMVVLTGIMASLSGGYAIYTIFRSVMVSLAFGVLWGFLIFSIDWYIVASLRKQQRKSKEFIGALPRLVLALLIAFVVSMPLKMKLFEREIEQQILFDQQQSIISYQSLVDEEFVDIPRLEQENSMLRQEIASKEQQRNILFTMIVEEAEGMSPTGTPGRGPVYREKKAEYDKVDEELRFLREQNNQIIQQNLQALQTLRERRSQVVQTAQITNIESDGFLARLKAMGTLSASNESIRLASVFIILLFITIESAPIIVKLISARGPYDDLLEAEEYIKQVEIRKDVVQAELTEDQKIDLHSLLEKERSDKRYEVEKEYIQQEATVLREINNLKIQKWKNEEIARLSINNEKRNKHEIVKEQTDIRVSAETQIPEQTNGADDTTISDEISFKSPNQQQLTEIDNSINGSIINDEKRESS